MSKWHPKHLKKRVTRAYHRIGGSDVVERRAVVMHFAEKHKFVYFHTATANSEARPIIRGSTVAPHQVDSNFCIGSHAGYNLTAIERAADVHFGKFEASFHRWYVIKINLKHDHSLPYFFLGTKQQSKAYYARVLTAHRGVARLEIDHHYPSSKFHSNYVLISSPHNLHRFHQLFDESTVASMGEHAWPFSIEADGDGIILTTLADTPSEQTLDKLLHYGLWFAQRIDEKFVTNY